MKNCDFVLENSAQAPAKINPTKPELGIDTILYETTHPTKAIRFQVR